MSIRPRDIVFASAVGAILMLLVFNSLRSRPAAMPDNVDHRPFMEALSRGEQREALEKGCVSCHSPASRPLSSKHPPKEQCLICHPPLKRH